MRAMPVLRVVKVVRLLRVVLMMTPCSRERYRRMKMIGIGAPVERVLQVAAAATTSSSTTTTTRSPPPPSPPPSPTSSRVLQLIREFKEKPTTSARTPRTSRGLWS